MELFGVLIPLPAVIITVIVLLAIIVLIVIAALSDKKNGVKAEIEDFDKREEYGDFHGLLTKEDFEMRADDHMLEVYRMQWIQAAPGDEKDNYLLLYLALKQLNKEQDASEEEWTQQQCEDRMDEIIAELSEKTGLKLIVNDLTDDEYNTYMGEDEAVDTETEESENISDAEENE